MQLHSSLIPVGLPLGIGAGWLAYQAATSMGALPEHAGPIAAWIGTAVNVFAGGAKNLVLLDILSLITVRPASAFVTFWGIMAAFARSAT